MRTAAGMLLATAVMALTACSGTSGADGVTTTAARDPVTTTTTTTTTTPTTTAPVPSTSSTTTSTTPAEGCLARATFGDPAASLYRLPYPPGAWYSILQSYCVDEGSHEIQLAYDFFMPIGSEVVAARAGRVVELVEDVADDAYTSRLNYLLIQHEDGSVAFYAHLTQDGVLVEVGDEVAAGETVARSGASGRTHGSGVLHFGVYRSYPPRDGWDLPVNFSNAEGTLDARGGLRTGAFYRALP